MSVYDKLRLPGELWLRDTIGRVGSANKSLSAVASKYFDVNNTFFTQFTSNNIIRFDAFYDCIFLETCDGYIFEKLYVDDQILEPFNYKNNFNLKYNISNSYNLKQTPIDYWFDEESNKIYWCTIQTLPQDLSSFEFYLDIRSFDCDTGISQVKLLNYIRLEFESKINWDRFNYTVEMPRLTFNPDTLVYNISFLVKNKIKQFGLVSINFYINPKIEIIEINSFFEYATINTNKSVVGLVDQPIADLLVTSDYQEMVTENVYPISLE
jgi:hypothetical protein